MTHKPTEEQQLILDAAATTEDNLIVSALAGAAKTTTLVMLGNRLALEQPRLEILCLAFNKKIATEMQERLPNNCKAMTLNSLGYRTWAAALGKRRLNVNFKKGFQIMGEVLEEQTRKDRDELYPQMGELMRVVQFGKACGYIPSGKWEDRAKALMRDEDFFPHIEQKLSGTERDVIRECSIRSIERALKGECDFDDQILMPTVFGGAFPLYKLTLIDEAQDLSALNHAMLRKIVGTRRLIAVGDQCQAIYGFRGAHEDGMLSLKQKFSMKEFRLTTSFRCAKKIVEEAQWRAPLMKPADWAPEGEVTALATWSPQDLDEDAAIICRNNAPLFSLAVKLLAGGRPAELGGKDVVQQIVKIMTKFGSNNMNQGEVLGAIQAWCEKEKEKKKPWAHGQIEDRAECMRVFAQRVIRLGRRYSLCKPPR